MKFHLVSLCLLGIFTIELGCKKKPPVVECQYPAYEYLNDTCQCPPGKYSAYGTCRELQENEWFGISSDCPCVDTMFIKLSQKADGQATFHLNSSVQYYTHNVDIARFAPSILMNYYPTTSGDTTYSSIGWQQTLPCQIEGTTEIKEWTSMVGHFSPDNDTLFVKFYYHDWNDNEKVVQTCDVVFTK